MSMSDHATLCARLRELADAVNFGKAGMKQFKVKFPVDPKRDAYFVFLDAAALIEQQAARIAELERGCRCAECREPALHQPVCEPCVRLVLERHQERIAELEAATRWRPISTAPIREAVLIYHPAHWNRLACLHENGEWYEWPTKPGGGRIAYEPFAWFPIPAFEEPKP